MASQDSGLGVEILCSVPGAGSFEITKRIHLLTSLILRNIKAPRSLHFRTSLRQRFIITINSMKQGHLKIGHVMPFVIDSWPLILVPLHINLAIIFWNDITPNPYVFVHRSLRTLSYFLWKCGGVLDDPSFDVVPYRNGKGRQ